MESIPKAVDTPEFRAEAVQLVEADGLTAGQAAKRLSIPKASPGNWVRTAGDGTRAEVGKGQRLPSELEMELA